MFLARGMIGIGVEEMAFASDVPIVSGCARLSRHLAPSVAAAVTQESVRVPVALWCRNHI